MTRWRHPNRTRLIDRRAAANISSSSQCGLPLLVMAGSHAGGPPFEVPCWLMAQNSSETKCRRKRVSQPLPRAFLSGGLDLSVARLSGVESARARAHQLGEHTLLATEGFRTRAEKAARSDQRRLEYENHLDMFDCGLTRRLSGTPTRH